MVTASLDAVSLRGLSAIGEVTRAEYRESERLLVGDDLVEALGGHHLFITEVDIVDLDVLRRLPDLRVVAACRGNAVNVDVAACTAFGIPVIHAPGRNAEAVADLTLAFILMLARRLPQASAFLRDPGSEAGDLARMGQAHGEFRGAELGGRTVGLVGLGAVGRAVARRLNAFGARILVHDPYVQPEDVAAVQAEETTLDEVLQQSDFLSLHAPSTSGTRGLLGAAQIARMKPGAFLVNTARAALVDEEALLEALRSGRLAGAALDVFSVEPPGADHPLLCLPNVIGTPHIGGNTHDVARHQGRIVLEDVRRLLAGRVPLHVLNPEVLEGFCWDGPRRVPDGATLDALSLRPPPTYSDLDSVSHGGTEATLPAPSRGEAAQGSTATSPSLPPAPPPAARAPAALPDPTRDASPRRTMERILRTFIDRASTDLALRDFAARNAVSVHYTVPDLGLEFFLEFGRGAVVAALGSPVRRADVRLKMKAEILDAVLTDRLSGHKAALTGKLAFSGDVRRAMGLQKVRLDLVRLYSDARREHGSPLGSPEEQVSPGAAASGAREVEPPRAIPTLPVASGLQLGAQAGTGDLRQECIEIVQELYSLGLITSTGGNVSVRIPGSDQIWITPGQLPKGHLRPEVLVRLDLDGRPLDPEASAPSSEVLMHCAVYKARRDVEAVIHAHAPHATILGLCGIPFVPITTEAAFLGDPPRIPFILPGTRELAEAVARALASSPAAILLNHGVVAAAASLRQAANVLETLERTSELLLGCRAAGRKPPSLPKKVIAELREMGRMLY